MPIRIREIHIKATISDQHRQVPSPKISQAEPINVQAVVAMCVDQVLRKLNEKDER